MRIARDGTWFYRGSPIDRKPLVKLFASVLRREGDGGYWLVTPAERGRIAVEDVPFIAVEVDARRRGPRPAPDLPHQSGRDCDGGAGPSAARRDRCTTASQRPISWCGPGLEARLARPVFYELVELGRCGARRRRREPFGVWSGGMFFGLGDPGKTS